MRVYIKNEANDFEYPEEMAKILNHLNANGKLLVSAKTVENLYRDFSDELYCAGWMGINQKLLEEFADWLEKIDL